MNCINNQPVFDLILIDMSFPIYPDSDRSFLPDGGIEILLELETLERQDMCVIITSGSEISLGKNVYPTTKATLPLKAKIECNLQSCIHYEGFSNTWQQNLLEVIKRC